MPHVGGQSDALGTQTRGPLAPRSHSSPCDKDADPHLWRGRGLGGKRDGRGAPAEESAEESAHSPDPTHPHCPPLPHTQVWPPSSASPCACPVMWRRPRNWPVSEKGEGGGGREAAPCGLQTSTARGWRLRRQAPFFLPIPPRSTHRLSGRQKVRPRPPAPRPLPARVAGRGERPALWRAVGRQDLGLRPGHAQDADQRGAVPGPPAAHGAGGCGGSAARLGHPPGRHPVGGAVGGRVYR